jgi:acyl-CoA thioesterase-1
MVPMRANSTQAFGAVAEARKAALVDFLLAGVATTPQLFQADNLHPTAAAQPQLLDNVWQGLAPLLK